MHFILAFLFPMSVHAIEIDTYRATAVKGSFCTVSGGACAGDTDFDSGFFQNPASLGASGEQFSVDVDFDLKAEANPELGGARNSQSAIRTTFGSFGYSNGTLGIALAFINEQHENFRVSQILLPISWRLSDRWILGLGVGATNATHSSPDWSLSARVGALYLARKNLSFGSWLLTPNQFRSGSNTYHAPLQWQTGAEWNPDGTLIHWLAQVDVIGTSEGGEINTYLAGVPGADKGRNLALQPRLGFRTPVTRDSHWNIYGGTYYEVSRVEDAQGREHLTAGLSYKLPLPYSWWEVAEIMGGVDLAERYQQFIITVR